MGTHTCTHTQTNQINPNFITYQRPHRIITNAAKRWEAIYVLPPTRRITSQTRLIITWECISSILPAN